VLQKGNVGRIAFTSVPTTTKGTISPVRIREKVRRKRYDRLAGNDGLELIQDLSPGQERCQCELSMARAGEKEKMLRLAAVLSVIIPW